MSLDEATLIHLVATAFEGLVPRGALGFVDDAAALPPAAAGSTRVVTTDMVVEGIDFARALGPLESAGYRALVQNASDLAAMGARPVGFVWSLALPRAWLDEGAASVRRFSQGAARAAREHGLALFGGDLSGTDGPMTCAVTAFGDVDGAPLLRSGARPGDAVYVSGTLGGSAAGLEVLLGKGSSPDEERACQRHLWPVAETTLGPALVGRATACIDVSDGLALDLARLCKASGVGAELDDVSAAFDPAAGQGDEAKRRALEGGEEYRLLFTLPRGDTLDGLISAEGGPPIAIGHLVEGEGLHERHADGTTQLLTPRGWDHFA